MMGKIQKYIEIVRTTIPGHSSMSKISSDALLDSLSRHYQKVNVTIVNDLAGLIKLVNLAPDLVFLGVKFITLPESLPGQNPKRIWISKYLDDYGITYTGSKSQSLQLEFNKQSAKQKVLDYSLATSNYFMSSDIDITKGDSLPLEFPLFVKPSNLGGGIGIDRESIVNSNSEYTRKVNFIEQRYHTNSIVENYLPGREFRVAIIKNSSSNKLIPLPIEVSVNPLIKFHGSNTINAKSSDVKDAVRVVDPALKLVISNLALNVFNILGARDYGMIDLRMDKYGAPQFLEANLIPSLISGFGSFPKACLINSNISYDMMVLNIVNLAFSRKQQNKSELFAT